MLQEIVENKNIKIGIDMDDTIYDFISPLLELYNKKYQDSIEESDINEYDVHKFLKKDCENLFLEFANESFFSNLAVLEDTINIINKLNAKYKVYFITAGHPNTIKSRDRLLSKYFDWYTSDKLIMIKDKTILNIDYLIDDNFESVSKGSYIGILKSKAWNYKYNYPVRTTALDFKDAIKIIEENEMIKRKEEMILKDITTISKPKIRYK